MRIRSRFIALTTLIACLALGGCLRKETTHTLYLDPDGSLHWSVLERDVRSDEKDLADRIAEEQEWLQAASAGAHPVAEALRLLGARRVDAHMVRSERPYAAWTEGWFSTLEQPARRFLEELQLSGDARLTVDGETTTFRLQLDSTEPGSGVDEESPLIALIEDAEHYRVVLTSGRFVEAEGFELDDADTVAVLAWPQEDDSASRRTLSLSWAREAGD
ncbi:MAG: hypothetical protein GY716_21820 [bacterium]|nr:hypothetical protein [bacterium]